MIEREREVLHVQVMIYSHSIQGVDDFSSASAQPDVSPILDFISDGTGASVEHKRSGRRFASILRCAILIR
jgi:hypothetical protein